MFNEVIAFIKENIEYGLPLCMAVDYFLGVTNIFKSNSIVEMPLRGIGYIIVKLLGGRYKMDKRKGVVK